MEVEFVIIRMHSEKSAWRNTQVRLKGLVLKTRRSGDRRRGSNPFSSANLKFISRDGSSLVARRAHNPKVVGSNPSPATNGSIV